MIIKNKIENFDTKIGRAHFQGKDSARICTAIRELLLNIHELILLTGGIQILDVSCLNYQDFRRFKIPDRRNLEGLALFFEWILIFSAHASTNIKLLICFNH